MQDYWMIEFDYFPQIDAGLRICECGAKYCIPKKRKGPTVLRFMEESYRVVCLACNKRGALTNTPEKAAKHWNDGTEDAAPGRILREWRKSNNYTQEDVAKMTGLSSITISHIEIGRRHPEPRSKRLIFEGTGIAL